MGVTGIKIVLRSVAFINTLVSFLYNQTVLFSFFLKRSISYYEIVKSCFFIGLRSRNPSLGDIDTFLDNFYSLISAYYLP